MSFHKIRKDCPVCKSKDISDGKNDFLYAFEMGRELPIQFCHTCHEEWFVLDEGGVK